MQSSASFTVKEKEGKAAKLAVLCSLTNSYRILNLLRFFQLLYVGQCACRYESAFVLTHKTKMRINLWMSEITGAVEHGVILFRCFSPRPPSSTLHPFLPQSFFQFVCNLSSFFPPLPLCSCTQRCLPALCKGQIASAIVPLHRVGEHVGVSTETRFRGQ